MRSSQAKARTWLFLPVLFAATGCVEIYQTLSVWPDGRGEVLLKIFPSPQAPQFMEGLWDEEDADAYQEMLKVLESFLRAPEALGKGSALIELFPVRNSRDWQGFRARYRIQDVTRLDFSKLTKNTPLDGLLPAYQVEFFSTTPAEVKIHNLSAEPASSARPSETARAGDPNGPVPDATADAKPHLPEPPVSEAASVAESTPAQEPASLLELSEDVRALFFEGLRISSLILVKGMILETNGKYQNPTHDGVLHMDVVFDHFYQQPDYLKAFQEARTPEALRALDARNIPGIRIQNPVEPLSIVFQ